MQYRDLPLVGAMLLAFATSTALASAADQPKRPAKAEMLWSEKTKTAFMQICTDRTISELTEEECVCRLRNAQMSIRDEVMGRCHQANRRRGADGRGR